MRKTWFVFAIVPALLCVAALSVVASGQPDGEQPGHSSGAAVDYVTLKGSEIYEGPQLPYFARERWFDYLVYVPRDPLIPIVVRELGIKPAYAFFRGTMTKRSDRGRPVDARPIMNLDVFGKLALGSEVEAGAKFDDRVRVELSPAFLRERTDFGTVTGVYFVFHGAAYSPEEFVELGRITDLELGDGLSFSIVGWPVDDLMLIGEGH